MRRTPLARGASRLARHTWLRARASQASAGWPRAVRAEVAARSGGRCELGLPDCTVWATDMHHRRRRREGDHRAVNALHCCRSCHSWCHRNPRLAREAGWIVSAWADPEQVPVQPPGRIELSAHPSNRPGRQVPA